MSRRADPFAPPARTRAAVANMLLWVLEPLESDPGYARRRIFGSEAAYLDGQLCLTVSDRDPPWSGLLVCTEHAHHASLAAAYPALRPHPVLGKWLYVPQDHEDFESTAARLVAAVRARDPRIGVAPGAGRSRKRPA